MASPVIVPTAEEAAALSASLGRKYATDTVQLKVNTAQSGTKPGTRKLLLILGIPIDDLNMDEALDRLDEFIQIGRRTGKTHQVATINADFVVRALEDPELRLLLQEADMATADGMPLVWGARKLGVSLEGRVAGSDLVPALAERAAAQGYSIYFLGAAPGIARAAAEILSNNHPGLIVAGVQSPPFSSVLDMDPAILDDIKATKPDILLVAFGNPKQEKWIGMYRHQLGVPVMIGVGATLDFIAGKRRRAPLWMQRSGLEWLHRLMQEPQRMLRRYGMDFVVFGTRFAQQWWWMRQKQVPQTILPRSELLLVEDIAIISIFGRLTVENVENFTATAGEALKLTAHLLLNFGEAEFLDSAAIGALVGLAKKARDAGGDLGLVSVPETIHRTLQLLHLDTFFLLFNDINTALATTFSKPTDSAGTVPAQATIASTTRAAKWQVVKAPRRLDAVTAAQLEDEWSENVTAHAHLVVDFSGTDFLTSAGLALLGKLNRLAKSLCGEVRIAGCSRDVHRVVLLARFDQILPLYPDLSAALNEDSNSDERS